MSLSKVEVHMVEKSDQSVSPLKQQQAPEIFFAKTVESDEENESNLSSIVDENDKSITVSPNNYKGRSQRPIAKPLARSNFQYQ